MWFEQSCGLWVPSRCGLLSFFLHVVPRIPARTDRMSTVSLCSYLPFIVLQATLGREEHGEQVGLMRTLRSGEVE